MSPAPKLNLADFLQRFSTKALWHFTGYHKPLPQAFNILKKIVLEHTLRIGEHPEAIIMPNGKHRTCYRYSCMCDIPFKDLRIHMSRYGLYGIAFDKQRAIIHGNFNPIMYVHKDAFLFSRAGKVLEEIDKLIKPHAELSKNLREYLNIVGVYIKRSNLTADISISDPIVDKEQNNNFYYEREWRSAYDWKFGCDDIIAVMVPNLHLAETRTLLQEHQLDRATIISAEMVEML